MKKLLLVLILCIAAVAIDATASGIALQQQVSPLHNLLHVEINLNNIEGESFDNITASVALPEDCLYFIRPDFINSGSFVVAGDFQVGGQTVAWTTGDSSVVNKQFHFIVFAHSPGTYRLTLDITDNQGLLHTYPSNNQTLSFPNVQDQVFTIAKNDSLQFNASDTFVLAPPATTPIKVAVRPNGLYGTATPLSTTVDPFTITYTPNVDFVGYDYFTIQAIDENGDTDGASVLVIVGVEDNPNGYAAFLRKTYNKEPEDKAPGAKDFPLEYAVDGGGMPVYLIDYSLDLWNATFPITYTVDTAGVTHGVVTLTADGIFSYAAGSQTGVDTIPYRVTDANNRFTDADITVNVIPFS